MTDPAMVADQVIDGWVEIENGQIMTDACARFTATLRNTPSHKWAYWLRVITGVLVYDMDEFDKATFLADLDEKLAEL